ncbi:alpha-galactosidase [Danxiaibacter flavus]|uniref:Alpha-galactosidase n=1 Tax=Danxiaibacter flavus TaxID=3049108 RepID=A0ABV3ZBL3_9BACT|nr:alpha-galactosidase [Chitinophagaceae bacterium DXS]
MKKIILTIAVLGGSMALFAQQQIIIRTENTAQVYKVTEDKKLLQVYVGEALQHDDEYQKMPAFPIDAYVQGGLNVIREPAFQITHADGNPSLMLQVADVKSEKTDDNVTITHVQLKDAVYPVEITMHFKAFRKENVIEQWSSIRHTEKTPVVLHRYSSGALQLKEDKYWLTHFFGDWANEMRMEETQLPEGIHSIESKLGTRATNFDLPSFLLSLNKQADEDNGTVLAGSLAWSGNFQLMFENVRYSEDFNHLLQIQAGINPYASDYQLKPNEIFTTPSFIYTYTTHGKGQASRNMHQWALNYGIYKGREHRQTLLNNWEATYFDFNEQKLVNLFDDAKKLGVELFLLDDGWFGNKYPRNSDNAGLGDWDANKQKLPQGIGYLVQEAAKKGVKFGIWMEPEMINPKSELYEKHKDWVLELPNRPEHLRRTQLVLDLANPAVQDYVYKVVDDLLSQNKDIAYIKWDCNRYMTNTYSAYLKDKQSQLYVDYVKGLYTVLKRLRTKYTDLEMMLCSGGGGRAEYGGLQYFQEFWPSDNTDPLSRIYMQWGYSYFFPAATICAHITSWGKQSIKFKTDVAMMGKLGFDIQVSHLKPEELTYCQSAIGNFKRLQDVIGFGDLYRLISPYENNCSSLMYVNDDKKKAVLFAFNLQTMHGDVFPRVILKGLDAGKKYKVEEINLEKEGRASFKKSGTVYSGDYLMKVGLDWFLRGEQTSAVLEITEEVRP